MKNRSLFSYLRSHEKPQAEKRNPILHSTFFILHSLFYILYLIKLFTQRYNFPKRNNFAHFPRYSLQYENK